MSALLVSDVPSLADVSERTKAFAVLLWAHLRAQWVAYVALWGLWIVGSANYLVGFNETASLPQTMFIVHKNELPVKGHYVAFHVPPAAAKNFSNPKAILTKIVVGMTGDKVTVKDRVVHVNGVAVGFAKTVSKKGEPLSPIADTVVGHGQYYVMGLHKDSLDSRYTIVGLVPVESVVGRAYPLF